MDQIDLNAELQRTLAKVIGERNDLRAAAQRMLDACKGGFFFPPGERERARQLSLAIVQLKQAVEASQ